jgi:hypothetical protein
VRDLSLIEVPGRGGDVPKRRRQQGGAFAQAAAVGALVGERLEPSLMVRKHACDRTRGDTKDDDDGEELGEGESAAVQHTNPEEWWIDRGAPN